MSLLKNEKGMGLIQVLVAVGIMGIIMAVFASMTVNQNREISYMQARLASADFQTLLTTTFAKAGLCTQVVTGRTFDSTNAYVGSTNPPTIDLPTTTIPSSTEVGAPPIATANDVVSPLAFNLKFKAMPATFQITNITGSGNSFTGTFQAHYNYGELLRAIRPAQISISLTTTNAGTTHTITSCMTDTPATSPLTCTTVTGSTAATCPAGYSLVGGGCTSSTSATIIANHTSMPSGNTWRCYYEMCWGSCTVQADGTAHAICCKTD